jgi:hypothetical protein
MKRRADASTCNVGGAKVPQVPGIDAAHRDHGGAGWQHCGPALDRGHPQSIRREQLEVGSAGIAQRISHNAGGQFTSIEPNDALARSPTASPSSS